MQKQIKEIRQFIDHLMIQSKDLSPNRETSLAYTHMQRGTMWLGLVLGALGDANPYPNSTNVGNKIIDDRADQARDNPAMYESINVKDSDRTTSVKWFRLQLENISQRLKDHLTSEFATPAYHELEVARDAIREAKMWFGWELNNIHNAENKQ